MSDLTDRYIDDHNMVERYAMRQLAGEDLDAFEVRLISDGRLREDVVAAESIIEMLNEHVTPLRAAKARPRLLAIAASFILAVSTTVVLMSQFGPETADLPNVAQVFLLTQTRSAANDLNDFDLGPKEGLVVLTMYPAMEDFQELRIRIERKGEQWDTIWIGAAAPGNDESIAAVVPSSRLRPGDHRMIAEGRNAATGEYVSAGTIAFTISR